MKFHINIHPAFCLGFYFIDPGKSLSVCLWFGPIQIMIVDLRGEL